MQAKKLVVSTLFDQNEEGLNVAHYLVKNT